MLRRLALVAFFALPLLGDTRTVFTRAAANALFVNTTGDTMSGALLLSNGTAAAPSIAFSSDADGSGTGLFRSAANAIGFSNNGVETMTLSALGNIGLGTAAPSSTQGHLLTAAFNGNSNSRIKISNSDAAGASALTSFSLTGSTGDVQIAVLNAGVAGNRATVIPLANLADFALLTGPNLSIGSVSSAPVWVYTNNTVALQFDTSQNTVLTSAATLGWGSSGVATPDLFIARRAAATARFGAADAASPVAQVLTFQRATGTNTAGVATNIECGGSGTGTATGSQCVFKVGTPQATGATAHVFNTAQTIQDYGLANVQRAVVLTGANVYQESIGNTKFVATDFTTASTSFVTITGLSWTMPAGHAMNIPFRCELLYSQATAAVANQFGIQDVTVAPTSLMAKATVWTSTTVAVNANVPALTTTTATSIVTFTPSAITTIWNATITGFIEQPSNAAESVINMLVLTGNASNSITVKRGSHCMVGF